MKKRKLKLNKITISKLQLEKLGIIKGGGPEISEQVCTFDCPTNRYVCTGTCPIG